MPAGVIAEQLSAAFSAGIVHQNGDVAECRKRPVFQYLYVLDAADVRRYGYDIAIVARVAGNCGSRRFKG